jgi:TonB family protein
VPSAPVLSLLLFATLLAPASRAQQQPAPATEQTFAALAQKLAVELREQKVKRVLVLDLEDPDGKVTPFGSWLGDQFALANTWTPIEVVDRQMFRSYLDRLRVPGNGELDANGAKELANAFQAQIVSGSYSAAENGIGVTLIVGTKVKVGGKGAKEKPVIGKLMMNDEMKAHLTVPLESLVPSYGIFEPNTGGISPPNCRSCFNPDFTEAAAQRGVQGTIVMSAVITPVGRASNVSILTKLDRELDQRALDAVRSWRFSPSLNVDGKPVYVLTTIEVSFRLSK